MGKKYNRLDDFKNRLEYLNADEKKQLTEHLLGVALDERHKKAEEIQFDNMIDYYHEINNHYRNWGTIQGIRTGYRTLDVMTMGLAPGELTVIGGATSNGKTLLSMNIASKVAMNNKNVLFVTLEMTKLELGVRFKKIMGDKFEDNMASIFWQKNDELTWQSIDGLIRKAKEDALVELIVIDHLHYFTRELENVAEDLGRITKELKKNAIRHNIPIILISHTRKGKDNRTDINDLRGSSYIAQDADIVLMVRQDKNVKGHIIVTLEKNRNRHGVDIGTEYQLPMNGIEILDLVL